MLFGGQAGAPAKPWLTWASIGAIDSGWQGSFSLEIDTFRTQLRVTAITLVEDPAHPESWLRDARLEYWDAAKEQWAFAQYLTSDTPIHTHKLLKPIEAAKFRLRATRWRGLAGEQPAAGQDRVARGNVRRIAS